MSETPTVYEKAITTERPAEMLAQRHGFENVAKLAESLPQNARVLDIGAGASPFGKEVALLRPDIAWVNFDYSYQDAAILNDLREDAPSNLDLVAGDATKLNDTYNPETFDVVFSYWLLPHLSIDNPQPAEKVANAIFAVTKPGGLMSIGPKVSRRRLPRRESGNAIQVVKAPGLDSDDYTKMIVSETTLSKMSRYGQRLANEVATPFFGTTRYVKREGRLPSVYHPESGEYVPALSRKGMSTAGRLAVALARHVSRKK